MPDMNIARALHVLAVVHWIGGVSFVTLVLLPGVRRLAAPVNQADLFARVESAFSWQVRLSVTLAGLTGFYMTHRLAAWGRFLDPGFWWMHAMVAIWLLFTLVLFVLEPLFLHRWFEAGAVADPAGTLDRIQKGHIVLLIASLVTVGAAVLGAHGAIW
jgi:uncharacterized membrane protein